MLHQQVAVLDTIAPTPERRQHDPIVQLDRLADHHGAISRPCRSRDILDTLAHRGDITERERQGGNDFRTTFRRAQLDPLRCSDIARVIVDGGRKTATLANSASDARTKLNGWRDHLGERAYGVLENVVGWEITLSTYAQAASIGTARAGGILAAALSTLANHLYGPAR